eukprot:PITA_33431
MERRLIVFIFITCLSIFLALRDTKTRATKPLVPAIYFFGDSTVDPGNNNELATIAKANFLPYGRDFMDHKPTGRFTNGKLVTDILSRLAGLPDIVHASLDPEFQGARILKGASFASAASGYDDTTSNTMKVLTLGQQVENFKLYRKKLVNMVGEKNASDIISGALFVISTGTDDFTNTYYINPITRAKYNVTEFQDHLLHSLSKFMQGIYSEGATLFSLISLPPFGCLPSQITLHNLFRNACVHKFNGVAMSFNQKAAALLKALKPTLPGLKMAYIDIYDKLFDIIKNPSKYGFEEARRGCCGTGLLEASILCTRMTPVCRDPTKHVFWDSYHPTENTYNILAHDILSQAVSVLHL